MKNEVVYVDSGLPSLEKLGNQKSVPCKIMLVGSGTRAETSGSHEVTEII